HSSASNVVAGVRPYAGGAPTVEVDFECGGERWRLRKRWLSQRSAELRQRDGADRIFKGEDAESELARLLAPKGLAYPFSLFWVGQGQSFEKFVVPSDTRPLVDAVIGAEIQTIAQGDRARRIGARVRAARAELVTDAQNRPRNAYAAALKRRDSKAKELTEARAKLAAAESLLDRLATLRERERMLADPGAVVGRREAAEKARAGLEAAREARARVEQAERDRRAAESRATLAQRDHDDLKTRLAQLADLDRADAEAHAAEAITAFGLAALTERQGDVRQRSDAAARLVAMIEAELALAAAAQMRAVARARAREVAARLETARAAAGEVDALTRALGDCVVTRPIVEAARRDVAALRNAETQLAANAPTVTISYAPGIREAIWIAGRGVGEGERIVVERPLVLDIAGVGTVTVTPAAAEAAEALIARRDGLRATLTASLAACGVATFDDLEAALSARERLESELGAARARLGGSAPDGVAALETALAKLSSEAGPTEETPARSAADIEGDLRAARAAAREAAEGLASISREMAQLAGLEAGRVGGKQARVGQREQLVALLPPPEARAARLESLAAALVEARAAADDAVRVHAAWLEKSPDAAGLARLAAELSTAEAAIAAADQELGRLRDEANRAEGSLENARNEDVANVVAELADEVVEAEADVARFELEVAALKRLETELGIEAAAAQAQYAEPVKARLLPYLRMLFADAAVSVDAGFGVTDITRANARESLDSLSKGTIEQVSVLARLAFARLLAEKGEPLPVILDDALVFSDDDRLERMFRALEEAATMHQTIVLTCHAQGFASLIGQRLQLTPWTDIRD
ncbi:MAG: hypothetical protein OEW98_07820, partial [Betaproteobacteria bacterium]|nr:hypothetical protein [Betaproteobacteria bacterium]